MSVKHLAVIGCGAVTELCHLPAVSLLQDVEVIALVDKDVARAEQLGKKFGIRTCLEDLHQIPDGVDGVIIALPNYLHAPVALEFLKRSIPVLVEKPIALNVQEAEAMIEASDARRVPLQVGLMRRYCQGARLVKRFIDEGWLGVLQSFSLEWGVVYNWPVLSGYAFKKEQSGGGLLMDMGSHLLDLLMWWLGEPKEIEYKDDSLGGVEADCWMSLVLQNPNQLIKGTVVLSCLRNLGTTVQIEGEQFTIEYDLRTPDAVYLWPTGKDLQAFAFISNRFFTHKQSWDEVYSEQLKAFTQAIATGYEPVVSGRHAKDCLALIERCYRERKTLQYPWVENTSPFPYQKNNL